MLIFANHTCINQDIIRDSIIFNLSSLYEGFDRINILPPFSIDRNDRDFDIMYANYILGEDHIFYEFMKITMSLYYGANTIILIDRSDIYEPINESLIKFIQQRYGIICNSINYIEDWECVQESEFTLQGLYNLDKDKERFVYIHAKNNKID